MAGSDSLAYLLWVEELPVGAQPDLVDDGGLQVHEDGPGNVLPGAGLLNKKKHKKFYSFQNNLQPTREESVEGIISSAHSLVARHLAIRLDPVLQAVELPAGVANLTSGLADVYRNTLSLKIIFPD